MTLQVAKNCRGRQPHSHLTPLVASKKCELAQNSVKIGTYSSSRSSKVIVFGTNRKRIYDFLLVINSNYGPILHRFWDRATYWLKIEYFSYPSLIWRPRSLCSPWHFGVKLTTRKLESWGYLVVKVVWSYHPNFNRFLLIDRQTDGQTDGRVIAYARYSILCCRAQKWIT